jgi:hypothetical protein
MRPLRFIRAVAIGVATFAKRRPGATFLVALFGVGLGGTAIDRWNETPDQTQAREAATARAESKRTAERERNRLLCKVKSTCAEYGEARQACATAGNFQNCIRVKMGDADYE